jgi:hypothetical protein
VYVLWSRVQKTIGEEGLAGGARGEQFGRYEAAIGTGQSNFWFGR